MLPVDAKRELVAVHESGHAVAALALDKAVRWIACDVCRASRGRLVLGIAKVGDLSEDLASALVLLAGDVAESLFTGRSVVGCESREALFMMHPRAYRVAREGTTALLRRAWLSVALLARELASRGRMTGGRARMFLDGQGVTPRRLDAELVLREAFMRVMTTASSPRLPSRAPAQLTFPRLV